MASAFSVSLVTFLAQIQFTTTMLLCAFKSVFSKELQCHRLPCFPRLIQAGAGSRLGD